MTPRSLILAAQAAALLGMDRAMPDMVITFRDPPRRAEPPPPPPAPPTLADAETLTREARLADAERLTFARQRQARKVARQARGMRA